MLWDGTIGGTVWRGAIQGFSAPIYAQEARGIALWAAPLALLAGAGGTLVNRDQDSH